jgi:hypothetical protein
MDGVVRGVSMGPEKHVASFEAAYRHLKHAIRVWYVTII